MFFWTRHSQTSCILFMWHYFHSLWSHTLMLSLKSSEVSSGVGSIKGPSVQQYFREWRVVCAVIRSYPPVAHTAVTPGASPSSVRPGRLSLCDVIQRSIQICWTPCFWIARYMHIDIFHLQKYPTLSWPWACIDWTESCLASFIWFTFGSACCRLLVFSSIFSGLMFYYQEDKY